MANTVMSPRSTRELSPDDFLAIRKLMRETDQVNAATDERQSELLRRVLADRADYDDVISELEAYNRRLQYILVINAYLLGREVRADSESIMPRNACHALAPLSRNCSLMPGNVYH